MIIQAGDCMDRMPVESSVLVSAGYLPQRRTLEIEFRSGMLYQYFDVPPETYTGLLTAVSKGAYFNANIRNSFSTRKIGGPSADSHRFK